jgi:hypothetical protein
MPVSNRHPWQLKTVVFLHRCLMHIVLLIVCLEKKIMTHFKNYIIFWVILRYLLKDKLVSILKGNFGKSKLYQEARSRVMKLFRHISRIFRIS